MEGHTRGQRTCAVQRPLHAALLVLLHTQITGRAAGCGARPRLAAVGARRVYRGRRESGMHRSRRPRLACALLDLMLLIVGKLMLPAGREQQQALQKCDPTRLPRP